jgi:AcrR family transcriptional regulator
VPGRVGERVFPVFWRDDLGPTGEDRRIGTGGPVLDGVYYYVMARPAKFSGEVILDTAVRLVADRGPVAATMAAISSELGAPTGSLYHRFESRDLMLAQAWLRTVREAQTGFVAALGHDDVEQAGFEAALHIPRWCRAHLDGARVLLLYRREDLVERWPEELGAELATLNDSVDDALGSYTARRFGHSRADARRSVVFALVDVPYGAVRRYLVAGQAPPRAVDELVRRTCACILGGEPLTS